MSYGLKQFILTVDSTDNFCFDLPIKAKPQAWVADGRALPITNFTSKQIGIYTQTSPINSLQRLSNR